MRFKINSSIILVSLIILLSLIAYINIFQNEFVWDDHIFILENSDIRSFSNLSLFFKEDVDGIYRPLRTLHYTFIYSIAGKNEFLYHFNSIFLHTLISVLIFFIIYEVAGKKISLVAALIFATHPIHTGRVTNITASFDLFGIFFMLLSFYFYIKFSKLNKNYFLFSLVSFIIALFSSEEAITLPLLIILYDFCFKKEKFNEKIKIMKGNFAKSYFSFFAIAFFYLILRFFILGIRGRLQDYLAGSFYLTAITMLKVYIYYFYLLIFPVKLTLFHEIGSAASLFDFEILISAVILTSVIFFTIKFYKNKILFFSVFWFFISLLPMSNILPLQIFMAERYLYVPSIGFSLLVSYFLFTVSDIKLKSEYRGKIIKILIIVFIALLLGLYSVRTIIRNADWKDNLTLWSRTVATNPNNSRAHDNLGFTYERSGDNEKALEEFKLAVELQPDNFRALANLGVAYAKLGFYNESLSSLKKSLDIKPYHKAYDKLALVYAELGEYDKSIGYFKKAIELNPRYAKAHNDLATVYGKIGEFDLALEEFNKAIGIDRDYADAYYNLGILLEFLGEKGMAVKAFKQALELDPSSKLYRKKVG